MNIKELDGLSIKDVKNIPSAVQLIKWEHMYYIDEEKGIFKVYQCMDCREVKKCTDLLVFNENNHIKYLCVPCEIRRDNKIKSDFYKNNEE